MAEYHVSSGLFGIYAGTVNKKRKDGLQTWREKSEVTDEALRAVRDYLYQNIKDDEESFGYAWDRKDGLTVKLVVSIEKHDKQ